MVPPIKIFEVPVSEITKPLLIVFFLVVYIKIFFQIMSNCLGSFDGSRKTATKVPTDHQRKIFLVVVENIYSCFNKL